MTRRDIIFIALLANITVLAILFMLAFHTEEEPVKQMELAYHFTEESSSGNRGSRQIESIRLDPSDEVDTALEEVSPINGVHHLADDDNGDFIESDTPETIPYVEEPTSGVTPKDLKDKKDKNEHFVEVVVKSGDALEKIARANGTTVDVIMRTNNLRSDKLKIGQLLQVPVSAKKKPEIAPTPTPKPIALLSDSQFYTMKSGDSLWKIAKLHGIRVDELLKLNDLDEDSARKLKTGDQIRIRY
jgi:peptidoglycan endopeptidase LytF